MNFTTTPPTKPGFYAWRVKEGCPLRLKEVAAAMEGFLDSASLEWVHLLGGEWCRLVPADEYVKKEEVEKAYDEGALAHNKEGGVHVNAWNNSRAKLIAEGKE